MPQVFDEQRPEWEATRLELRSLLSGSEYDAARRTTINAHYTDPTYVSAIWSALEDLGFSGGEVLEPGSGVGTFIGMAPDSAHMTGVELDPTTAAISSVLYPDASIRSESFATTIFPNGYFTATVGNVPFGDIRLHDPRFNGHNHSIHNHFIIKSLELTQPGGMVAVLSSSFTLDAADPSARRDMAAVADLVGAVRLPSGAHARSAGTDAVTDVLILRRRREDEAPRGGDWDLTTLVDLPGPDADETQQSRINNYFLEHPDRVLGTASVRIGMYGAPGLHIAPRPDMPLAEQLRTALGEVVAEAQERGLVFSASPELGDRPAALAPALASQREGQIIAEGDHFLRIVDGVQTPLPVASTHAAEVRALLNLRDQARSLIDREAATLRDDSSLAADRAQLHATWQGYVQRYGPINRFTTYASGHTNKVTGVPTMARRTPPPVKLIRSDPYGPLVLALENFDELTQHSEPASILLERQVMPRQPVQGTDDPDDAIALSLDRTGRVDLDLIADLLGVEPVEARTLLGTRIFEIPPHLPADISASGPEESSAPGGTSSRTSLAAVQQTLKDQGTPGELVSRSAYLSGNVRLKLEAARSAAVDDARWQVNVDALRQVIPTDLGPGDIVAKIGSVWIPAQDYETFMLNVLHDQTAVVRHYGGSQWEVTGNSWSVAARNQWGTEQMPAPKLLQRMLRQESIVVRETDSDGRRYLNLTATEAAVEKAQALQDRFADWIWEDPQRSARLVEDYNQRFNSTVLRDYTELGQNLTLPGLIENWKPREHQRTAVARMLHEPSVGLFHQVGAGKTAEMVMGAMEMKRLGLVHKPAVVVPNHMLEQFSREWLQLYPQATLLLASSGDLRAQDRRTFVARVATGDWDGVVMTRSAFEGLKMSPEHTMAYTQRSIEAQRRAMEAGREAGSNSAVVKRIEKALLRSEEKMKELLDVPKDPGVSFENTGIDYLFVDELHEYKNLETPSSIKGAGITDGSQRATDLDAKLDFLRHQYGDRVITGATATPISNSVSELYVMQRYLAPQALEAVGITDFDSWAATFGQVVTAYETNVVGDQVKLKERFARFQNVPELVTMFHQFADVKTAADLHLPTPAIADRGDGKRGPRLIEVEQSTALADYIQDLSRRAEAYAAGRVDNHDDNMGVITQDGRKAALDMRLVLPESAHDLLVGDPTKIDAAAALLTNVWHETKDNIYLDRVTEQESPRRGALQIVFCDMSTPKDDAWNVYDELRNKLHENGLPQGSVRFIHEAKTDAAKARLFAACRSGEVSVLIGSTAKMGVGTNIQDRAIHMLDMDAPWRPADVEQRHGRIVRQGNQNPEIQLSQLVTIGSFDTYMWQTLERKQKFIDQIMTNKLSGTREIEDIGDTTLTFAEFKAVASGNPLLLEQTYAHDELQRLTRLRTAWQRNETSLQWTITSTSESMETAQARLPQLAAALDRTHLSDTFSVQINGRTYDKRPEAAADLVAWLNDSSTFWQTGDYGPRITYAGHPIHISNSDDRQQVTFRIADTDVSFTEARRDLTGAHHGLITKLENLVEKKLPAEAHRTELSVAKYEQTLEQAQSMVGKPFRYSAELHAAQQRYDSITAQISQTHGQEPVEYSTLPRQPQRDSRSENTPQTATTRENDVATGGYSARNNPTVGEGSAARQSAADNLRAAQEALNRKPNYNHDTPAKGPSTWDRNSGPDRGPSRGR